MQMKNQRGVGLVEVMISMLILSVGLIAVIKMQLTVSGNVQLARQRWEAVALANSKIEQLRGQGAANCVSTAVTETIVPAYNATTTYTRTSSCDNTAGTKMANVTVTWNDARGTQRKVPAGTGNADNQVKLNTSLL